MLNFIFRRLLWMVLTLWVVFTATFFLVRVVPGGPYTAERKMEPEIEAAFKAKYRLDLPVWQQYSLQLRDTLRGDLGRSMKIDTSVNRIVRDGLPVSAVLGSLALGLAFVLGITAGIISAVRRGSFADVCADEFGDHRHHASQFRNRGDLHFGLCLLATDSAGRWVGFTEAVDSPGVLFGGAVRGGHCGGLCAPGSSMCSAKITFAPPARKASPRRR